MAEVKGKTLAAVRKKKKKKRWMATHKRYEDVLKRFCYSVYRNNMNI